MSLKIVSEMWSWVKDYVNSSDKQEFAEALVDLMIEEGYSEEEIKDTFDDVDINSVLKKFNSQFESDEFDEYDEENEDHEDSHW